MIREALTNLLDNALDHGGADLSKIMVSWARENARAVLTVTDDGIGLAKKDIPKVMARFGQAQPGKGSGLGLPIAEAVALRHGGTLRLLPQKRGLAVQMILPLNEG